MARDTPLSEEQIKELNEISQLSGPQQQEKLQTFLKKLTPEQLAFLKKQQGGGCLFCSIVEGQLPSKKVYENDLFVGVLDIKPAAKGHLLLFPKKHYQLLGQMSDAEVAQLFTLANTLSRVVFEGVQAEGTNIYVANGGAAGQVMPHVVVHIIPRWKGDKVMFSWEGVHVDEKEMHALQMKLQELAAQYVLPPQEGVKREEPTPYEGDEEERTP